MTHCHAVVWFDHYEVKVFHFNALEAVELRVMPDKPHIHLHYHRGSNTNGHSKEDQHHYHNVASAVADAGEVLVRRPGPAKNELVKYIERRDPAGQWKLIAIEAIDHPSDKQLVAHVRKYFLVTHRMKSRRG